MPPLVPRITSMPTAPKPAPPPAPKPVPASQPSSGWAIYHRFSIKDHQAIEAVAVHESGVNISTGPLVIQSDPAAIRPAMALLEEVIQQRIAATTLQLDHQPAITIAPPPAPADPQPAPPQPAPPADNSPDAPASAELIAQVRSQVQSLTPEWQSYVLEMFRIEFDLPADQKLASRIKSNSHCSFIQSVLPSSHSHE